MSGRHPCMATLSTRNTLRLLCGLCVLCGSSLEVWAMKIVVAPQALKGSVDAGQAGEAIAAGVRAVQPEAEVVVIPVADGGEGTVRALVAATGGELRRTRVTGPLGEPVEAEWGLLGQGTEGAASVQSQS